MRVDFRTVRALLAAWLAFPLLGCTKPKGATSSGFRETGRPETQKEKYVIVFRRADGRTLSLQDLKNATGTVRYEVIGREDVPDEAQRIHQQARTAGSRGDHDEAIRLLNKAAALAPRWPYSIYDRAFTHLLRRDFDSAMADYRKTVKLAPRGFFTAITAVQALEREKKGELPSGTYLAFVSLEWIEDPLKKAEAVQQLVEKVPGFAPAWKELANLTDEDAQMLQAIESGLGADPDAETRGVLLVNKALLLERQGHYEQATRILGELALNPDSTLGTEQVAKVSLALITKRRAGPLNGR